MSEKTFVFGSGLPNGETGTRCWISMTMVRAGGFLGRIIVRHEERQKDFSFYTNGDFPEQKSAMLGILGEGLNILLNYSLGKDGKLHLEDGRIEDFLRDGKSRNVWLLLSSIIPGVISEKFQELEAQSGTWRRYFVDNTTLSVIVEESKVDLSEIFD